MTTNNKINKIGIVGLGFVGTAVLSCIKKGVTVSIYDKYKSIGSIEDVLFSDCLFICLPTPADKVFGQDLSEMAIIIEYLLHHRYLGIIIIKSTVKVPLFVRLYDSIKMKLYNNLKTKFNNSKDKNALEVFQGFNLRIVFNPEFLSENNYLNDFRNQRVVLLGSYNNADSVEVREMYKAMFDLSNPNLEFDIMSPDMTMDIKYYHNIYHAYKVLFWNYVNELNGNSRKVSQVYKKILDGIPNEMDRVAADGELGYGGNCFPKDVFAQDHLVRHSLTEFMIKYNNELRGEKNVGNDS